MRRSLLKCLFISFCFVVSILFFNFLRIHLLFLLLLSRKNYKIINFVIVIIIIIIIIMAGWA